MLQAAAWEENCNIVEQKIGFGANPPTTPEKAPTS